jgi:hypothetical protein
MNASNNAWRFCKPADYVFALGNLQCLDVPLAEGTYPELGLATLAASNNRHTATTLPLRRVHCRDCTCQSFTGNTTAAEMCCSNNHEVGLLRAAKRPNTHT